MTGGLGGAAARGLDDAAASVDLAVRGLAAADDVAWVSAAASRYRAVLAQGTAALRAARTLLDEAADAVAVHDAAVAQASAARLEAVARQVLLAGLGAQAPGPDAPDLLAGGTGRGLW
ncbi:MAG: hypothetical protein ACOH2F_07980 [Cellulomonas sp.]